MLLQFLVCFSLRLLSYGDGDPSQPHLNLRGKYSSSQIVQKFQSAFLASNAGVFRVTRIRVSSNPALKTAAWEASAVCAKTKKKWVNILTVSINGIRNPLKKVPSDRFFKKKMLAMTIK